MQGISYDFIGFHENRWDAAAGGAAGGHPGTEYMDVPGTKEFIWFCGVPPRINEFPFSPAAPAGGRAARRGPN